MSRTARTASQESPVHAISDADFGLLTELLRARTGIDLSHSKKPLLAARLFERMAALNITSFGDYYSRVLSDPAGELTRMTDAVCTNETRFFRDEEQSKFLVEKWFPSWFAKVQEEGKPVGRTAEKPAAPKRLRVWSAGCSTGQEAFTIAMLLLIQISPERNFALEVLGSDLSNVAIEKARAARFDAASMLEIPKPYRSRFFTTDPKTGDHVPKPELRNVVRFHRFNLFDWYYPVTGKFDLILCRNVLIYFNAETRAKVARKLAERLSPNGALVLGMTESLLATRDRKSLSRGSPQELWPGLPPVEVVGPATYAFARR
ncbi:MAG: protein-glutamate O-methyltransferase CheR [Polyangiaceae bacterium]|nr:protein-glutamate O-methyltransferase CheR [Polyangiaceae bacterium]